MVRSLYMGPWYEVVIRLHRYRRRFDVVSMRSGIDSCVDHGLAPSVLRSFCWCSDLEMVCLEREVDPLGVKDELLEEILWESTTSAGGNCMLCSRHGIHSDGTDMDGTDQSNGVHNKEDIQHGRSVHHVDEVGTERYVYASLSWRVFRRLRFRLNANICLP